MTTHEFIGHGRYCLCVRIKSTIKSHKRNKKGSIHHLDQTSSANREFIVWYKEHHFTCWTVGTFHATKNLENFESALGLAPGVPGGFWPNGQNKFLKLSWYYILVLTVTARFRGHVTSRKLKLQIMCANAKAFAVEYRSMLSMDILRLASRLLCLKITCGL